MKGRKPKPTALKILDGTRGDRVNRDEPTLPKASVEPPDWLDDLEGFGIDHWNELAPMLSKAGLLTEGDRPALALLCRAYARLRLDPLDDKANDLYRRMLVEFGLTPSSRSRIKATAEKPKDALAEFLASKRKSS